MTYINPDRREQQRLAGEAADRRLEALNLRKYGFGYVQHAPAPQKAVQAARNGCNVAFGSHWIDKDVLEVAARHDRLDKLQSERSF